MTGYAHRVVRVIAGASLLFVGQASGFDRLILGSKLDVADKAGLEPRRSIRMVAKESPSDIAVLSDPTVGGATLTVVANGGASSIGTYALDASGWKHIGTRYIYRGPTGGDGDPVRLVTLGRSSGGTVQLRVVVKGNTGTQNVEVVPPNPGNDGGVILDVAGGDRYCASFGAGAGGTEVRDSALQWKIIKSAAQPGCPSASTTTSTTTSASTTTSTVPIGELLCPNDPTRTIFAGGPGNQACTQFDGDQESCEKAFHIGGECGVSSCWYDFQDSSCRGCGPNNEDSGRCVNTCINGAPSCPGDPTRTIFAGYANTSACTFLSYSQTLCEKAFQINGVGQPATCYWDTDNQDCRGCGPNNLDDGRCQNTCPVCEGDTSRTLFAGGPGNAGCHKYDASPSSCAGAFIMSGDTGAYTSCYYDAGLSECRGCGPNNQSNAECINACPTCADPVRQIFVGGPGSGACHLFDYNPSLCEQSFHMSGACETLASCYYDYDNNSCNGCGPFNQQNGACSNVCSEPICGNGVVDLDAEHCDGTSGTCGPDQSCSTLCQCVPCGSQAIPPAGGVFNGVTSGTSAFAGSCGFDTGIAPENVYAWTPSTSHQAIITTCPGADFDTVVYVREGSCNGPEVACDDDSCSVQSLVQPFVTAGTTYYIVVDGYGGDSGSYTLLVSPGGAFLD